MTTFCSFRDVLNSKQWRKQYYPQRYEVDASTLKISAHNVFLC